MRRHDSHTFCGKLFVEVLMDGINFTQAIQQAEDGLKELDAGIIELKKRADKLQIEQPSMQELSKLQVHFSTKSIQFQ